MSIFNYPSQLICEERSHLAHGDTTYQRQPFLYTQIAPAEERFTISQTRERGQWSELMTPEQTAYALAQVTAANILPPLTVLQNGSALLQYCVLLRAQMDDDLVNELSSVLTTFADAMCWDQIAENTYACVIGSGVAACIDLTPGGELVYLRYANRLAAELYNAESPDELPRSLLFLQTALYERFDILLAEVRMRAWFWLVG